MKKWLRISLWILFTISVISLLGFARSKQHQKQMKAPEIELIIQDGISLLTEEDILEKLKVENLYSENIQRDNLKIAQIESFLNELNEVEHAEVFMELGDKWEIKITIRKPIVRVLTPNNPDGFYIDHQQKIMKTPPVVRPRTLIATGLENSKSTHWDVNDLINNDSLITHSILSDIYRISTYVCNSPLYRSQIVQIHYNEEGDFVLIPRVGRHEILFGSAKSDEEVMRKFKFLTTFYEEVIPFEGWNTYSAVNLKFENQIVAKKK